LGARKKALRNYSSFFVLPASGKGTGSDSRTRRNVFPGKEVLYFTSLSFR
jgi:hypothetical protein